MMALILNGRVGRAIAAAASFLAFFLGLRTVWRREGAQSQKQKAKEADHEQAQDIRDRVDADLPDRVRDFDNSGWRD